MIKNDKSGSLKIHAVRLCDGNVTTFDTNKWSLALHFGNSYQLPDDQDVIVVEASCFENPDSNPFNQLKYEYT